jgi:hypothetical protein
VGEDSLNELELVLLAIPPSGATVAEVAARADRPVDQLWREIERLELAHQVEILGDRVRQTRRGAATVEAMRRQSGVSAGAEAAGSFDLTPIAELVEAWASGNQRRAAQKEAARDALLASDADRDMVGRLLADAFAQGRLNQIEFEERTSQALAARTHGELDGVLRGLGGLQQPSAESHAFRRVVFWVMTVLTWPFLLLGGFALAFGSDLGDRVFGIVLLVLFLPGLLALRWWAWRRRDASGGES